MIINRLNLTITKGDFVSILGSSGSVVPLFKEQLLKGGPITLTHKDVVRYFMTIPEASQLVIQASELAKGGDVFLLDMGEPVKIETLAKQMIKLSGLTVKDVENPDGDIEIIYTGLRPGEKLFEELLIEPNSFKTDHPLIYKALESMLSYEIIEEFIRKIGVSISKNNKTHAIKLLKEIVPEWEIETNT